MNWRTYLVVYFGTDGDSTITEMTKKAEEMGFKSTLGPVDLVYDWDHEPSKEEVYSLGDKLKVVFKGTGAIFNLDTHD